jgi:hypothetical protein
MPAPPPGLRRPALPAPGALGPLTSRPTHPSPSHSQPAEFVLSAAVGSLVVVALASVRIYLGWRYVGDRLFSAAVPYEESGWCAPGPELVGFRIWEALKGLVFVCPIVRVS